MAYPQPAPFSELLGGGRYCCGRSAWSSSRLFSSLCRSAAIAGAAARAGAGARDDEREEGTQAGCRKENEGEGSEQVDVLSNERRYSCASIRLKTLYSSCAATSQSPALSCTPHPPTPLSPIALEEQVGRTLPNRPRHYNTSITTALKHPSKTPPSKTPPYTPHSAPLTAATAAEPTYGRRRISRHSQKEPDAGSTYLRILPLTNLATLLLQPC